MKNLKIEVINDLLLSSVGKKENQIKLKVRMLMEKWPDIVGQSLADHSSPIKLEGKELWIGSDPGGWLQNISLMSGMILPKIKDWWGDGNDQIQKLKVIAKRKEKIEPLHKIKKIPRNRAIPKNEDKEWGKLKASVIHDEKLRDQIYKAMAFVKAREELHKQEKSPQCEICGIFIEKDEMYCSVCDLKQKEDEIIKLREILLTSPWISPQELQKMAGCSLMAARDARRLLLGDLAFKVPQGEEMSGNGLTLVMLITGKKPMDLTEEIVKTTWERVQREIRFGEVEKIKEALTEYPRATVEIIQEIFPLSIKEFELARRQLLGDWRKKVPLGREVSGLGLKAVMLVTHQEIEIWEEERIYAIWDQIRKNSRYIFSYKPGQIKKK